MPIFEYVCRECEHRFERIVHGSAVPACPACEARNVDKQISAFAVGGTADGGGTSSGPGSCGTCGDPRGPGSCRMN